MSESDPIDLPWNPPSVEMNVLPLGVEAGELDRALDRVGAVVDEERVLQIARGDLGEHPGERRPPWLEQLLAVERHALELVGHRLHDPRVIDAGAEDAVSTQAVDVLAAEQVVEYGALPRPFERGELAGLGDGLPVGDEAPVVVLLVALDRLGDEGLLLLHRHLPPGDQLEISSGVPQDLGIRQTQLIGAPFVRGRRGRRGRRGGEDGEDATTTENPYVL